LFLQSSKLSHFLFSALQESYSDVAEKFQPHGFFYSVSPEIARKHVTVTSVPSVFVYKENTQYLFPG
jgi:hypothetical protein